ncbi:MAG: GNAT family N-acetyltransferase [Actinobacteria bacterium]|nr:GNAT family N-acetyltransferase [Actinomycetota bacterium]
MSPDVALRPVAPADLPILFEQQLDPEAAAMAVFASRDREAFLEHWRERVLGDPEVLVRTVVVGGRVAGTINSFVQSGERLVGYWIGREFWGRGVASAALRELLRVERRRPLRARVATTNEGSIRVLEKGGFVDIGSRVDEDGVEERLFVLE